MSSPRRHHPRRHDMRPALRTIGRARRPIIGVLLLALAFAFAPTARSQAPPIVPGPTPPTLPGLPTVPGPTLPGLPPSGLPLCAWLVDVSAQTLNIAAPDTHTHYWVQPYRWGPQSSIVINGTYPFARYFSFVTYTANGVPTGPSLHDSQILPDAGSVNPFTTPTAPTDPAQRRYTVRVVPPPATATNTLPGLPADQTTGLGFLVYRLYL